MDDALLVRGFDGVGDLSGDGDGVIDGNRSGGDPLRQVRAIDELHDQGLDRRTVLETVNLRDVRMIERGQRLRFAREAGESIVIGGERVRQDLQGDVAIELRVASAIHLAHATGADGRDDLVRAESGSWGERQDPVDYSVVGPA
jgi:hypothetical protein